MKKKNVIADIPIILYSKGNKSEIRAWQIIVTRIKDDETNITVGGHIKITHGVLNGKLTSSDRRVTKGKNIGKSNQTTAFVQAKKDAQSLITKQQNKGYYSLDELGIKHDGSYWYDRKGESYKTLKELLEMEIPDETVSTDGLVIPMRYQKFRHPKFEPKSKEYKKSRDVKSYPVYSSPKLDGTCCVAQSGIGLSTRGGKKSIANGGQIWNEVCPQIYDAINQLNYEFPLNGEVYKHGYSLQQIKDACTKRDELSGQLEFHIFDIIDFELPYEDRYDKLVELYHTIYEKGLHDVLKIIPARLCSDVNGIIEHYKENMDEGFEGSMITHPTCMYRSNYRTPLKLKLVLMDSMELIVTGVVPYENNPEFGKLMCNYPKWHEFYNKVDSFAVDLGSGFTHKLKKEVLKNKENYIGKLVTISHRGFTPYNIPRIAKGEGGAKAFRTLNDL